MTMRRPREEVRILLIGDRNVGKTSLILSLVRETINQIYYAINGSDQIQMIFCNTKTFSCRPVLGLLRTRRCNFIAEMRVVFDSSDAPPPPPPSFAIN